MAKRFIDTGIFDDDWFMELSKDAKLMWLYFITKCDHAGMIKVNERLCKLQTDIKDLDFVIKQLGNRLVTVSQHLYFIPKFIEFQYPGFPNSKVRQQASAVDILIRNGILNPVNEIIYEDENLKISFENFWNVYNKKSGDKEKIFNKWKKLRQEDRDKIFETLPVFLSTIKDKQYQPFPETYLNNKRWNDEIDIKTVKKLNRPDLPSEHPLNVHNFNCR
jgi:hypothetical protein